MKIVGKIFAVFSSILYTFILTALMIVAFSSNLLSADYYTSIMKSVDFKTMRLTDLGVAIDEERFEADATVEDVLVSYFTEGGVDEDLAKAVINNEKIREVVGKFIGDYINYNVDGERPVILRKDIEAIFNEPDVKALLDQSPEKIDVDIDVIYDQLNDLVDEILEGGGNYDNSKRNELNINPNW